MELIFNFQSICVPMEYPRKTSFIFWHCKNNNIAHACKTLKTGKQTLEYCQCSANETLESFEFSIHIWNMKFIECYTHVWYVFLCWVFYSALPFQWSSCECSTQNLLKASTRTSEKFVEISRRQGIAATVI